ncbi:MAG TPA: hypothetical protein VKB46_22910, partial [Pyrinomonadaceae bacterium]|nr:hypothetical protein [Pyrinomonadaceae bacterium]
MNEVDTKPVRASEELDWGALECYLRPRVAELLGQDLASGANLKVTQFPGGHSNLTYLLCFGDHEV